MAKRRVSNLLALAVLACVAERPMHPYEISTTLRTRGKEQSIKLNFGSLYSVVESLTRHGLIEAQETVREGRRPERTIYAITAAGRAEMEDWLAELLSTPTKEYTSLEAALSLAAGLAPDEVARLLTARAARLRMDLGSVEGGLAYTAEMGLPELFVIEEQYRKAMMEAELAFVTDLADRISHDKLGGVTWWRRVHELQEQGVTFEEIARDPEKHLGEEAAALAPFLNPG
ncbi:MAG: PadR family transcriptional regulator [Nocardioidaceae bacterium]|nr:PadR family transcriptional regulator [Nocardioidaceae bacterium]NUS50507.1 PadR family transcriptional regulator [Nocardioidaceae bacterium]